MPRPQARQACGRRLGDALPTAGFGDATVVAVEPTIEDVFVHLVTRRTAEVDDDASRTPMH